MKRTYWLWILGALLLAGYALPYTVLAGQASWSGAFLFWLLFGIAVWALLTFTVMRWRVGPGDRS